MTVTITPIPWQGCPVSRLIRWFMPRNPQEFVRFVARHYRLMAGMCRENERFASDAEIEAFVRPYAEAGTNPAFLIGRMKSLGILSQTTGDWTPPPFLGRFLAEVEQRHALASPGVVRGWVEKLSGLAKKLDSLSASGIPASADDELELSAILDEITDTISTIAGTVGGNCDRIGAEVAHYRAEEDSRRLRFRLARLIDLHTNYLEPLLRLIDIGGEFYGVSEQVVASCDRLAAHALPGRDSLTSLLATAVSRDVVWLRRGTLRRAHEAHRELGPLCEAAMRESAIARGVNRALEAISSGDWQRFDLDRQLAVIVAPDGPLLNDRAAVACLLAARSFRDTPPPLLGPVELASMEVPWTVASLREELDKVGAVEDVFEWICERVGRDQPDPPAALLHDLIEAAPECLSVVGSETHLYPFARIEVEGRVWAWNGESHA